MNKLFPLLFAAAALMAARLPAREVSLGQIVCNPGAAIAVPVTLDEAQGLAVATVAVNYDPELLLLQRVEQGTLKSAFSFDFTVTEEPGYVGLLSVAPGNIAQPGGGTLATLHFLVRPGSAAMVASLALADVSLREETMTADLAFAETTTPTSGLVRPLSTTADCAGRLTEGALIVAPNTTLRTLALRAGDSLCAADDQAPIVVTDALTAEGTITVLPPERGWGGGSYALLTAPTADLSLAVVSAPEGATLSTETDAATGLTTYRLATNAASGPTVSAGEVDLSEADAQGIRDLLSGVLEAESGITAIVAQGPQEAIELAIDLGLEPEVSREGSTLTAAFALPTLTVTAFEPETGTITVCVTPGAGAQIAKTPAETTLKGILHLRGTNALGGSWESLPDLELDLSAYQLNPGEITLTAQFGSHTFLKVTAGRVSAEDPAAP